MIPVEGMFTSGVIAELKWDGKAHRLIKIGRMVAVSINEQSITDQILRRGDRIKIGNTRFRYEMPED
jgi:hypothetical protein